MATRRPFEINRLLPMATNNMHMKFQIEIPKQTWATLRKPCRLQTDGQTDRRTRWFQYTPPPISMGGGIMKVRLPMHICVTRPQWVTGVCKILAILFKPPSLWPSVTELDQHYFRHWLGACLLALSHYLNQTWLIIKGVLWHSPESDFRSNHELNP